MDFKGSFETVVDNATKLFWADEIVDSLCKTKYPQIQKVTHAVIYLIIQKNKTKKTIDCIWIIRVVYIVVTLTLLKWKSTALTLKEAVINVA